MTMMCSSMSDVTRAVGNTGRILTEILSFCLCGFIRHCTSFCIGPKTKHNTSNALHKYWLQDTM